MISIPLCPSLSLFYVLISLQNNNVFVLDQCFAALQIIIFVCVFVVEYKLRVKQYNL